MAKRPTIVPVVVPGASAALNQNFEAIAQQFDEVLSRDGSTPNQMEGDIDLNSNDIINVDNLTVDGEIIYKGRVITFPAPVPASIVYSSYQDFINANVPSASELAFAKVGDQLLTWVRDASGTVGPTADGGMWSPAGDPSPLHWGAAGNGTDDDTLPVTAAFNYANIKNFAGKVVDLKGKVYAISSTVTPPDSTYYRVKDGGFVAIGSTWQPTDYMFDVGGFTRAMNFEHVMIDCSHLCNGVLNNNSRGLEMTDCRIVHFTEFGLNNDGGTTPKFYRLICQQWEGGDPERTIQANRTAVGIRSNSVDAIFIGCYANWCRIPLQIASQAHHTRFIGCHFFNGQGGENGPHIDPISVQVDAGSFKNELIGTYLDNGYIDLYSTNIIITNTVYLYNAANASLSAHVRLFANSPNSSAASLVYANNLHSNQIPIFELVDVGTNTWETNPAIEGLMKGATLSEGENSFIRTEGNTNLVAEFLSSNTRSVIRFRDLTSTIFPDIGSSGNHLAIRTNGTERFRVEANAGGTFNNFGFTNTGGLTTDTLNVSGASSLAGATLSGDLTVSGATSLGAVTATGTSKLERQLRVENFTGTMTFSDAEAGAFVYIQNGATVGTLTLPTVLQTGWNAEVIVKGSGTITLQADAGASLNGTLGGSVVLPQNSYVKIICAKDNADTASEYFVMGL